MIPVLISKILLLPILVWISWRDIKTQLIPTAAYPLLLCFAVFIDEIAPIERIVSGILSSIPPWAYAHKTKRLGMGDVKLIFCFAWCAGIWSLPCMILAWTVFLLTTFKRQNKKMPYSPYLCGAFAASLFLPYII